MNSSLNYVAAVFILLFMLGCTSGELRQLNDVLSEQNGYSVSYPDQSSTDYVGDIKWVSGVRNGEGFQYFDNTGDNYCRVKVTFEDESYRIFNLEPYESTSQLYMSVYNQAEGIDTICNTTSAVFRASFDD